MQNVKRTIAAMRWHLNVESVEVLFLRLTLVICFMPNVSFSLTNFDTQPFAAGLGILCILLTISRRFPLTIWYLAIPAFASLVIAMIASTLEVGARSFVIYASPWIFACTAYLASLRKINISKYVIFMLYLWALIGLIQWLINPQIIEFLVNTRTTDNRGVTSLAPEPSFYGLTVILMWLTLLINEPQTALKMRIVFLCIFQILILSQSILAIGVLLILLFMFVLRSYLLTLAAGMAFFAFLNIFNNMGNFDSRIFALIDILKHEPSQILYLDASISERASHIFLSLKYAISSGLLPHGFEAFSGVIVEGQNQYDFFWFGGAHNKIMSGIGGAVYELGWISIIYFYVFYGYLSRCEDIVRFNKFVIGVGIFVVLLNSVTFSSPCFGLMIGILASLHKMPQTNPRGCFQW